MMIVVAYDGTGYSGFASQKDPKIRTIEGELNRALSELTGEQIEVCGASRTDAGVHALCNYAVFDTHSPIPAEKFAMAVNTHLPSDIRVRKSMEVVLPIAEYKIDTPGHCAQRRPTSTGFTAPGCRIRCGRGISHGPISRWMSVRCRERRRILQENTILRASVTRQGPH